MAIGSPFVWGDAGAQMTPDQIAAQRKVALALMEKGGDYSPVQSPWQGAARVSQALLGGMMGRDANEATKANAAAEGDLLLKAVEAYNNGGSAAPSVSPASAQVPGRGPSSAPEKIYDANEPSPLDPPMGIDRDKMIRTIYGEDPGASALGVANVIRNRAVAGNFGGDTPSAVVAAPGQFEPWSNPAARARMESLDPNSPTYQRLSKVVDQAYAGDDPTKGAKYFYSPTAQAALGRANPAWAVGPAQDIGGHRFYGGAVGGQPAQVVDDATLPPNAQPSHSQQGGINPALLKLAISPYTSDAGKKIGAILLQHQLQSGAVTTVDLGNAIGIMDKRGNIIRQLPKGEPNKGPEYGVIGKDEFDRDVYGWKNPRDQSTKRGPNFTASPSAPSSIPVPPPGVNPKDWREGFSKSITGAAIGLPDVIAKADQSLQIIDQALKHPGRETATGVSGLVDPRNYIPGTNAKDFLVIQKQLQGKAFLEAFQTLKGGGQITEIEGKKATEAIARLDTSQSDEAYVKSLKELREVISNGIERAKKSANPNYKPEIKSAPIAQENGPAIGVVQDGYMFKGGDPANKANWEKV